MISENLFYPPVCQPQYQGIYQEPFLFENPEVPLAKEKPLKYLKFLEKRIEYEHRENLLKIMNSHKENMNRLGASVAEVYLSGLSSDHRDKICDIEIKPYVWENSLFGFKRRDEGITIKFNRRA